MSDILSALMEYADNTFRPSPAYWEALNCLDAHQQALEAGLAPPQQVLLDAFLEAERSFHAIDAEDVLCAGIAMGLELRELISPRKPPHTPCR